MRPATLLGILGLVIVLGGTFLLGIGSTPPQQASLTEAWVSDTARNVYGNHHPPAVTANGTHSQVFAPLSGQANTSACGLVALNATTGGTQWTAPVPPENCTIHSVADPAIASVGTAGEPLVLAATTEHALIGRTTATGHEQFRVNLSSYGYTEPLPIDLDNDGGNEIVVVDVRGSVYAYDGNESLRWQQAFGSFTWARPAVIDGDDTTGLILGLSNGSVHHLTADGAVRWTRTPTTDTITWMSPDRLTPTEPTIGIATTDGQVIVLNGTSGDLRWRQEFDDFTAVYIPSGHARSAAPVMYVTAADGVIRQLNRTTGEIRWSTTLTNEDVQMTPPPRQGDVDGDGTQEIVAVTNDGGVLVLAPDSGDILATYTRDVPIYTHPVLADVSGDGAETIFVMYGDGRVHALNFTTTRSPT